MRLRASGTALVIASLLMGTIACVSQLERNPATPTSGPDATAEPTTQATAVPSPTPTTATGEVPTPTATPTNIPVGTGIQRGLFLEIEGISDESIVFGDTVVARGKTAADAVLSINSIIIPIQPDGTFEVLIALSPGPNLIEVVASNLEGEEVSWVIAVISLPGDPTPTATPQGGSPS